MRAANAIAQERRTRRGGFSIVELMLALAILGLLLAFAAPSYSRWIAGRRLANHAEFLVEMLNAARSEAVKRGMRVNLCKSRDQRQCDDGATWESGWIMFADENRDGRVESAESIIRVEGPPGSGITIAANLPVADYVSYTSFGFARALNGALQMGTFVVCMPGQTAINVVLANSGRARIDRTARPCN
jgi:type IV fimbrial biogenesis protein FimT